MEWSNHGSDPIGDMQKAFSAMFHRRWVCKRCGTTTYYEPSRPPTLEELREQPRAFLVMLPCRNCTGIDYELRTDEP